MEHQCLRTQRDAARLLGGRRPKTSASMSSGSCSIYNLIIISLLYDESAARIGSDRIRCRRFGWWWWTGPAVELDVREVRRRWRQVRVYAYDGDVVVESKSIIQ